MVRVSFTPNLARHLRAQDCAVEGDTVREALEQVFTTQPQARHYLLDDQGAVRRHVVIFVDGEQLRDRDELSDRLEPDSTLDLMQALSGG